MSLYDSYIKQYIPGSTGNDGKILNIKGIYSVKITDEEKIFIDCIREENDGIYREELEINTKKINVNSKQKVFEIDDLAVGFFKVISNELNEIIKISDNIFQYKEKTFTIKNEQTEKYQKIYVEELKDWNYVPLDPDDGKEALIYTMNKTNLLKYNLPIDTTDKNYIYNFNVDWGDGTKTVGINNSNMNTKASHTYSKVGTYEIKIEGKFEALNTDNIKNSYGIIEIKQWGTTNLRSIHIHSMKIEKISKPTQSSFKNLEKVEIMSNEKLNSLPEGLFANCINIKNFKDTFMYCSNLTSVPENLFANCISVESFDSTFAYTGITSIPENLFVNCPNVKSFDSTFNSTGITSIPENLFAKCPNVESFGSTFCDTGITSIPENLFINCSNVKNFSRIFTYCYSLTSIPENLFARCINVENFQSSFARSGITNIPENLFANCLKVKNFGCTFESCDSLKGKPIPLWNRVENGENNGYIGNPDGEACYTGSIDLENYEKIPKYWRADLPQ